jgi:DNA-binding transcriptional ArsR family regulator
MKPSEIEMANFLESLKAPQSRRIVDTLHEKPLTEIQLIKNSKLSKRSIELHLLPLIRAKLIVKKKQESSIYYALNKKLLKRNADWFAKFLSNK